MVPPTMEGCQFHWVSQNCSPPIGAVLVIAGSPLLLTLSSLYDTREIILLGSLSMAGLSVLVVHLRKNKELYLWAPNTVE
jgi:hypothetical protein